MGYSTTTSIFSGREIIICDGCGHYPAKKHRCPFNYCPPAHFCASCWEKVKIGRREKHAFCKTAAAEFEKHAQEAKTLLESGFYLRRSALLHDSGRVKVIFSALAGSRAFFMAPATYDKIPIGKNATIEDYKNVGELTPARNCNIYDEETGPAQEGEPAQVLTKEVSPCPA